LHAFGRVEHGTHIDTWAFDDLVGALLCYPGSPGEFAQIPVALDIEHLDCAVALGSPAPGGVGNVLQISQLVELVFVGHREIRTVSLTILDIYGRKIKAWTKDKG
jgi:hypothetical protein